MNNTNNIELFNLLKYESHEKIKENLLNEIYKISKYCVSAIGEGFFGKVYVPPIGPYFSIKIDDSIFVLPIVIKETKNMGNIFMSEINKDLIIYSDMNLTCEAIMLFMISKYWYKSANPHLPFLVGLGNCNQQNPNIVTHIITERHGLLNKINFNYSNYIKSPFVQLNLPHNDKYTYLATCGDLFEYIVLNYDDKFMCDLPSGKIYVPAIIDYFCIFYLHTSHFLWENLGITLSDQHPNNIFVHWINENSILGKKTIKNLKVIYYELSKNKFLNIPINGLLFKIGDIGTCLMNIQKNVIIVGDIPNPNNLQYINIYKQKTKLYIEELLNMLNMFPLELLHKTKIFNLLHNEPYLQKYIPNMGFKNTDHENVPTELDILNNDIFKEFHKSSFLDNNENFTAYIKIDI